MRGFKSSPEELHSVCAFEIDFFCFVLFKKKKKRTVLFKCNMFGLILASLCKLKLL